MIVDALADTEAYIEKKELITITANAIRNNDGYLRVDDLDNQLISKIDSGHTPLYRVREYTGKDYLLLYNPTTKQMQLVKQNSLIDLNIDFISGTQYFIGAKRLLVKEHTKNVYKVDLGGYKVFKIFLDNGIELSNYTYSDGELTIRGMERNFIDEFSQIVMFIYLDNKIVQYSDYSVSRDENNSNPQLDFKDTPFSVNFVLEYYNYASIYDSNQFMSGEYFESTLFTGEELMCFDKLNINESTEKETSKNNFRVCNKTIIKRIDVTSELELFSVDELLDTVQYLGRDEFRILLVNPVFGRIFILNNCFLDNGIPMVFQKEGNRKTCKISCGNYIDIVIADEREYGRGKYGKGLYGSGTWVTNSYRREV